MGDTVETLTYGEPTKEQISNLKCPQCGNTEEFVEYAYRPSVQPFSIKNGEPEYDTYDFTDDVLVSEIVCGSGRHDSPVTVWSAKTDS